MSERDTQVLIRSIIFQTIRSRLGYLVHFLCVAQVSLDFRQRVMAYKKEHDLTFEQTIIHFDVEMRTLFRWATNITPCITRNKPKSKIDENLLLKDIEGFLDDYQWEREQRPI
ncbi:IS630 transposase-related protein [Candidatus Enterovibrio escicola]|nr:IS630 transposase-related protein [Candidatus Enterovibrio escacola]